ncbi:hypothetical protein FGL86_10910 [Pistricoccus aurantiacus]|uniref:Uncharacterized protein n=1 Tax=Pistricoccus aurantiacus TaxID=1883414 RepID=A0A5B8SS90_9GAMM|nr:hypothetical protein [Pistricoccus aurantiacus]QEA39536.1 hypothetical protein FGL86_10910 [Pistricoccus aurantiacus]
MLISDSMPLLWLVYLLLSLVVLVTGHLGIRFLPRLPRWVLTGVVAGLILMPGHYTLPMPEQTSDYTGWAPAIVMAVVAKLQHQSATGAFFLLAIGAGIGALLGILIWQSGRRRDNGRSPGRRPGTDSQAHGATPKRSRREPVIG